MLEFLCDNLASSGREPRVVISSTWRKKHREVAWWNELFARHNAHNVRVVGMTPDLGGPRGKEVDTWLAEAAPGAPHVIFDDDSDFDAHHPLILTRHVGGLHLDDIDEAFRKLTGKRLFDERLESVGKWKSLRMIEGMTA